MAYAFRPQLTYEGVACEVRPRGVFAWGIVWHLNHPAGTAGGWIIQDVTIRGPRGNPWIRGNAALPWVRTGRNMRLHYYEAWRVAAGATGSDEMGPPTPPFQNITRRANDWYEVGIGLRQGDESQNIFFVGTAYYLDGHNLTDHDLERYGFRPGAVPPRTGAGGLLSVNANDVRAAGVPALLRERGLSHIMHNFIDFEAPPPNRCGSIMGGDHSMQSLWDREIDINRGGSYELDTPMDVGADRPGIQIVP
jgi:hypothetical protein